MKQSHAGQKSNRRQWISPHEEGHRAHICVCLFMYASGCAVVDGTSGTERETEESMHTSVARKNAIKSPEYRWIKYQFTGDVMKYLFTRTDCCLAEYCYGQYYFTSLTLTTPIENEWQDTTNCRQIHQWIYFRRFFFSVTSFVFFLLLFFSLLLALISLYILFCFVFLRFGWMCLSLSDFFFFCFVLCGHLFSAHMW